MLTALTAATRWTWIVGNHDPGFTDQCGGEIVDEAEIDGLVLRHEADPARGAARAFRPFPSQAQDHAIAAGWCRAAASSPPTAS